LQKTVNVNAFSTKSLGLTSELSSAVLKAEELKTILNNSLKVDGTLDLSKLN
jgi:hypothetical protein